HSSYHRRRRRSRRRRPHRTRHRRHARVSAVRRHESTHPLAPRMNRHPFLRLVPLLVALVLTGCSRHAAESAAGPAFPADPAADHLPAAFNAARAEAHRAITANPQGTAGLATLARLHHANGFYAEAAACWQLLLDRDPANARW